MSFPSELNPQNNVSQFPPDETQGGTPSVPLTRVHTARDAGNHSPTAVAFSPSGTANTWSPAMPGNFLPLSDRAEAPSQVTLGNVTSLPSTALPALFNENSAVFSQAYTNWQQAGHPHGSEQEFLQKMAPLCLQNVVQGSTQDAEGRKINHYLIHPDGHSAGLTVALRFNHDHSHSLQILGAEQIPHANHWKSVWISQEYEVRVLYQSWTQATGHSLAQIPMLNGELNRMCQQADRESIQWVNAEHLIASVQIHPRWMPGPLTVYARFSSPNGPIADMNYPPKDNPVAGEIILQHMIQTAQNKKHLFFQIHTQWQQAGYFGQSESNFLNHISTLCDTAVNFQEFSQEENIFLYQIFLEGQPHPCNVRRRINPDDTIDVQIFLSNNIRTDWVRVPVPELNPFAAP